MTDLTLPPADPSALYLYRGVEVSAARPIMTGDVFSGVEIPGVDAGPELALIMSHPCSMRDGAHLRDHLMVCSVRKGPPLRPEHWLGNVDVMPLPGLDGAGRKHRAEFDLAGRVPTLSLDLNRRVACLSDQGMMLLLQRLAFSHTRVAIDLPTIRQSVEHLLEEAELLEQWVEAKTGGIGREPSRAEIEAAEAEFDVLLRQEDPSSGLAHRARLKDPMARASIRRMVARALGSERVPSQEGNGSAVSTG